MKNLYKFSETILRVGQLNQKFQQVWSLNSIVLSDEKYLHIVNLKAQSIKIYQFDCLQACLLNQAQCVLQNIQQSSLLNLQTRIRQICFDNSHCFIILSQPFEIYMVSPHQRKQLIKISLENSQQEANLNLKEFQECLIYCTFPNLYLFGFAKKALLLSLNLLTYTFKQIDKSAKYGPQYRKNYISCFNDDRLYVTGGFNKNHKPFLEDNNLLWTFDLQKGFWFALQVKQQAILQQLAQVIEQKTENGKKLVLISRLQGGKMLIASHSKQKLFLFQLYQSKISQIQSHGQKIFPIDQIIHWNKRIYVYKELNLRQIWIEKLIKQ